MNNSLIQRLKIKEKVFVCISLIIITVITHQKHIKTQLWLIFFVGAVYLSIHTLIQFIKIKNYNKLEISSGTLSSSGQRSQGYVQRIRELLSRDIFSAISGTIRNPTIQPVRGQNYQLVWNINEIPEEAECPYRDGVLRENFQPGEVVRCNRCGTLHHKDCFERWGCGSLMCSPGSPPTLM